MKNLCLVFVLMGLWVSPTLAQNGVKMPEKPKHKAYRDYRQQDKGFWCSVEGNVGSHVMLKQRNMQYVGVAWTLGYRFSEFVRTGIGIGGKYYFNNISCRDTNVRWTFPLFANLRGNFISQRDRSLVPFWSVNVGAALRDGFFLSPSLGLRFGEERNAWLLGIGYNFQCIDAAEGIRDEAHSLYLSCGYEF